jgi:hypothetical protein
MAGYLVVKSYLEKNNPHYFNFFPISEEPMKADSPAEDISNSLEYIGFSVIHVSQITAIQTAPKGQTDVETHPLFLLTLTRNIRSQ